MSNAIISECGKYRYRLTRGAGRLLPVVMLNPSTADAKTDDPTIRRLLGFASSGLVLPRSGTRMKFGGLDVVNLYALRSSDPNALKRASDPYGPCNNSHLDAFCRRYGHGIVLAWGAHASAEAEANFMRIFRENNSRGAYAKCFGVTKEGHPKHPLYLKSDALLSEYDKCWL